MDPTFDMSGGAKGAERLWDVRSMKGLGAVLPDPARKAANRQRLHDAPLSWAHVLSSGLLSTIVYLNL